MWGCISVYSWYYCDNSSWAIPCDPKWSNETDVGMRLWFFLHMNAYISFVHA